MKSMKRFKNLKIFNNKNKRQLLQKKETTNNRKQINNKDKKQLLYKKATTNNRK